MKHDIYDLNDDLMNIIKFHKDFWHKRINKNFDPFNVFLVIATKVPWTTYDWFCGPGSDLKK